MWYLIKYPIRVPRTPLTCRNFVLQGTKLQQCYDEVNLLVSLGSPHPPRSMQFWRAVTLINKTDCSILTLYDGSKLVDGNRDKAINNYFYSTSQPPLEKATDPLEPATCPTEILCIEDEVFDLVASLDISKSAGPDGISAKMLKGTAVSIVNSLTKLFNQSILQGTLPRAWKIARILIVPIPKNTEKSLPKNYIPAYLVKMQDR